MKADRLPDRALRILLVEDDNHIGRIVELAMPDLGIPFEFVAVLSAEEGLEQWEAEPFHIILTDYNLRGMNGLEMVKTLRQQGVHIPILLVTAYDSQELRKEARALGVDAYVTKPFFLDELIHTIRSLLPTFTAREVNGK